MRTGDTIAAIASDHADRDATHACVRISGPDAFDAVNSLLDSAPVQPAGDTRRILLSLPARWSDAMLTVPAWLISYRAPASFTGEDVIELIVPAHGELLDRLLAKLTRLPQLRHANAGEFSARAYLNNRLSLDQAEGIAALIASASEAQAQAAESIARGSLGKRCTLIAEEIISLLALTEAGIDFTDQEDVVAITPSQLVGRLDALLAELQALSPASVRSHAARCVLVGPPNAGKSTLFNALLGHERSITSPIKGTTRDAIVEHLDLRPWSNVAVELIDLPGLDESPATTIDADAQAMAREHLQEADVLLVCDALAPVSQDPRALRVRTKADQPQAGKTDDDIIAVCALDGWGLDALRQQIAQRVNDLANPSGHAVASAVPRYEHALAEAAEVLAMLRSDLDATAQRLETVEVIAAELRAALDALSPIIGRIEPDEVIGRVFATFCVGK